MKLPAHSLAAAAALGLFAASTTIASAQDLEVIAELETRPGNPAIGADGTIYLSMQPFDGPEYHVVRLENDGSLAPFPTPEISKSLSAVIGIHASQDGVIWVLDMGGADQSPKLLGWSPERNELEAIHYIPKEFAGSNPFIQDLAVDTERGRAYIADMSRGDLIGVSEPAIIVIDLKTGLTRRVLEGHASFQPEPGTGLIAGGAPVSLYGGDGAVHPIALGLNPIGIDETGDFVYFSSVNPGAVYRVPADILGDFNATDAEIADAIEAIGQKKSSDGFAVTQGRVILTNVDEGTIDILEDGERRTLISHPNLVWPDGVAVDSDGSFVVTANQLHKLPPFMPENKPGGVPPYFVLRITE